MQHRNFPIRLSLLIVFIGIICSPILGQNSRSGEMDDQNDRGMISKNKNYTSFDQAAGLIISDELNSLTPDGYKHHPEYGKLPYNTQCEDCFELIDKRTATTRSYVEKGSNGSVLYNQSGFMPINYKDGQGNWRAVDPRLFPSTNEPNVYRAANQQFPTAVDLNNKQVSLSSGGRELVFNKNLKLYHATETSKTLIAEANWQNNTVGSDGTYIKDIFPGVDLEVTALHGALKTNFIVADQLPYSGGWLVIEDELGLPFGAELSADQATRISHPGYDLYTGNITIQSTFSGEHYFEIGKAVAYDEAEGERPVKTLPYHISGNNLSIVISLDWMTAPERVYPITIDPLVTASNTLPLASIAGSGGDGSGTWNAAFACSYFLTVATPTNCTITDILWSFDYIAQNGAIKNDGAVDFLYNGCRSPNNALLWWTCQDGFAGTCAGSNISIISDLAPCVPAAQCTSYNMNFTMRFYDAFGSACDNSFIGAASDWVMTVQGRTVEQPAAPTSSAGTTICSGSTTLTANGSFGVGPYTYSWSPAATLSNPNIQNPVATPTSTTTYTCTITDACGQTAVNSVTITVDGAVANAGADATICSNQTHTISGSSIGGTATSQTWSTSGDGSFDNAALLNPTYTPGAGDASAGTVTLTMTTNNPPGPCPAATDNMVLTIDPEPTVNAGTNASVCPGVPYTLSGSFGGSASSITWTTGGDGSFDNASLPGATYTPGAGDNLAGTVTLTITTNDPAGPCTAVADNITLTLSDVVNPTITCPADVTVSTDAGLCTASGVALGAAAVADNCAVASTTNDAPATYPTGVTVVTWTVTDAAGNSATCTQNVTVNDTELPTITCPGNQTGTVDASCNFTIPDYTGLASPADNCGVVVTQAPAAGTIVGAGTTNIVLTATDPSSNTATCNFDVVVSDVTPPTITCPGNQTGTVDASCNFTLPDYTGLSSPADNCPGVTVTQSPLPGTTVGAGTTNIVLTATDGASLTATCNFDVVVSDATAPTITCPGNQTGTVDASCNFTIPDYTGLATPADNCPGVTVTQAPLPGTVVGVGTTNIVLTATDGAALTATCNFDVIVSDVTAPIFTSCPGNQNEIFDASCQFTLPDYTGMATATDNCGVVITQSPIAGTVITGLTTITLTATDPSSNTATCTFDVIPTDAIPPTAVCQNVTIYVDGAGNATATAAAVDNGSTDNCGISGMSLDVSAFTCADLGANAVVLTVTDGTNNATCNATVTVLDTVSPTAVCQDINVYLDALGNATATAAAVDNGSSDNCSVASLVLDVTAFTCADVGANPVVLTVTDGSGNTSTCNATVTVLDTISPTAVCQDISVALDATGNASIVAADIDNGSTDNCTAVTLALDITSFTCADIGVNVVTLTVTDGSGNTATCTANVTVTDPNVPTAAAGPDGVICDYDTYTLAGSSGGSATTGSWSSSLDGTFSSNTDPNAVYTPGPLAIGAGSVVLTWTTDPSPCATASDDMTLTINPAPTFTVTLNAQPSGCGISDGSILISGLNPSTNYDLAYDSAGITINMGTVTTDASGEILITGLGADSYNNFSLTINGCTTVDAGSIGLSDPSAPIFTVSISQQPTSCGGTQGEILISGLNPSTSYDLSYDDDGTIINMPGITTDGSGNYLITGLDAGTYTTFVISLAGCTGSDATVLVLTDPPAPTFTVTLTSDPTSCGGTDGVITISGLGASTNYDISYDDDGTPVSLGTVTTDGAGNYVITGLDAGSYDNWSVTDGINCTGTDATVITLTDPGSPTFTVTLTSDPSICGASDGSITISGLLASTTYDITYDDDGTPVTLSGITTDGAGNYVIAGLNAGDYDNWAVTLAGCTGTDATIITLTDPPPPAYTVTLTTNPTVCGGADGSITISGLTPSTSYDIGYDDDGTPVSSTGVMSDAAGDIIITGLDAGTYDNWMVTLMGCTGMDPTSIVLTDPGAPTFTVAFTSDPTTCGGTDGSITISGLLPSTSYDIGYDDDGTPVSSTGVMSDAAGDIIITGLDAGTYDNWLVTLLGCTGTDATSIVLTDPGSPTFTVGGQTDPTTCGGTDGSITISGLTPSTTYDITYDDDGTLVTLTGVTTDASGNYVITGLDAGTYDNWTATLMGCTGTDVTSIVLTDPGAPTFTVSGTDPTTCFGTDGTIVYSGLSASTTYDVTYDDGTGATTVTLTSDAAGDIVITGLGAGSYDGFTVDLLGCVGTDGSTVTLSDPPTPTAPVAGSDASICDTDPIVDLTATAGFGGTLEWFSDAGLTTSLGTGTNLTPSNTIGTTVYYVNETANGCSGPASTVTVTITTCVVVEVEIPTGFSPDNDGVNDVWEIPNLNILYPDCNVRVFNRWGNVLFESNGYGTPWDGTNSGEDLPVGSYFFTIDFGDDAVDDATGSVTIIR